MEIFPVCNQLGSPVTHRSDVIVVTFFLRKELIALHARTLPRGVMPPTNTWPVTANETSYCPLGKKPLVWFPLPCFARSGVQTTWLYSYSFKHVLLIKIVGERLKLHINIHHSTTGG